MDSAEPVLSARSALRNLARRRRALLVQGLLVVATGGLLVVGASGLDSAPWDLAFLFLAGAGIYSLAAVHVVDELASILCIECPRCAAPFFGGEGLLPSPLRRRCSHCRVALDEGRD